MKKQSLLLLAALAGIAGIGWYLKTKADANAATSKTAPTGSTLAQTLSGTQPKSLLDTLAGLIATKPASSATTSATATTPAPSLIDTFVGVPRVGQRQPTVRSGPPRIIPSSHQPTPGFENPDIIVG